MLFFTIFVVDHPSSPALRKCVSISNCVAVVRASYHKRNAITSNQHDESACAHVRAPRYLFNLGLARIGKTQAIGAQRSVAAMRSRSLPAAQRSICRSENVDHKTVNGCALCVRVVCMCDEMRISGRLQANERRLLGPICRIEPIPKAPSNGLCTFRAHSDL